MGWEDFKKIARKNIIRWIVIGFVVLLGIFVLLSLFRIGIIFWLYSSINNWATVRLGLDEDAAQWLTIVLVCLTTFFFPSLALHSLLFGKDKFKNIAIIIGGQTLVFLLVSTVGKEVCFDIRTGNELCWYVDTPEGRKFYRRDPANPKPCFDPKYGLPCRLYTREMAKASAPSRGRVPPSTPQTPNVSTSRPSYRSTSTTSPSNPSGRAQGTQGAGGITNTKLGDTYIIEYLNLDNPKSSYRIERKVVSVGDGNITVAAQSMNSTTGKARMLQFTSEWNFISSRNPDGSGLDYSPPLKYFEFPLDIGKTWQQTSRETNIQTGAVRDHTLSATVGDWEEIDVPAGKFRAIKITIQIEVVDPSTGQKITSTDISWYAPDVRRSVKSEITSQNFQGHQERQLIQMIQHLLK